MSICCSITSSNSRPAVDTQPNTHTNLAVGAVVSIVPSTNCSHILSGTQVGWFTGALSFDAPLPWRTEHQVTWRTSKPDKWWKIDHTLFIHRSLQWTKKTEWMFVAVGLKPGNIKMFQPLTDFENVRLKTVLFLQCVEATIYPKLSGYTVSEIELFVGFSPSCHISFASLSLWWTSQVALEPDSTFGLKSQSKYSCSDRLSTAWWSRISPLKLW